MVGMAGLVLCKQIYSTGIFCHTQEYYTYTMAASVILEGNWAMHGGGEPTNIHRLLTDLATYVKTE